MAARDPILAAGVAIRRHKLNDTAKRKRFAKAVVARRIDLGLTRDQFRREVGISYYQAAHIETATHWPSLPVFEKICEVLKVGKPPLMG